MQDQIDSLKRDIGLHKDIENELAKKFHKCQKQIKTLNEEVKTLDNEYSALQSKPDNIGIGGGQKKAINDTSKTNEDLVNFLEHKLMDIENKLTGTQSDYETLQRDYVELQDKLSASRDKYKRAALIMTDFLQDMINSNPNILNEANLNFDVSILKTKSIENLSKEEKMSLVNALLTLIQPFLSASNLSVAMAINQTQGKHGKLGKKKGKGDKFPPIGKR